MTYKLHLLFLSLILLLSACTGPTCGDGVLEEGETRETCCADASCLGDQTCSENGCVEPTCTSCQTLSNHICVDNQCCDNNDCEEVIQICPDGVEVSCQSNCSQGSCATCEVDCSQHQNLCLGIECDDSNTCTTDSCSAGTCSHVTIADGTPCDEGMHCQKGVCVEISPYTLKILSSGKGEPNAVDIYEDDITWRENTLTSNTIKYMNINSGTIKILDTVNNNPQGIPKIHKNNIIWTRDDRKSLAIYDINTGKDKTILRLDNNEKNIEFMGTIYGYGIENEYISFTRGPYYDNDGNYVSSAIYLYNIQSEELTTIREIGSMVFPDISNSKVLFSDNNAGGNEILLYDIERERTEEITTGGYYEQIDDDKIVYTRWKDSDYYSTGIEESVYEYSLDSEKEEVIADTEYNEKNPNIQGDIIIWKEQSFIEDCNCKTDKIHVYNMKTKKTFFIDDGQMQCWYDFYDAVNIYENKIVYGCQDKLYLATIQ